MSRFEGLLDGLVLMPAALTFLTVGTLVAWRRPRNPLGWIMSIGMTLMLFGGCARAYGVYALLTAPGSLPAGVWVAWLSWTGGLGQFLVLYFSLLLLPNGRLAGRRWHLVAYLAAIVLVVSNVEAALRPGPLDDYLPVSNPLGRSELAAMTPFVGLAISVVLLLCIASFVVRFWRARGEERQQLKWIVYAVSLFVPFHGSPSL